MAIDLDWQNGAFIAQVLSESEQRHDPVIDDQTFEAITLESEPTPAPTITIEQTIASVRRAKRGSAADEAPARVRCC